MIVKKIPAYIGLLHTDGTEPDPASGYHRVGLGDVAVSEIPYIPAREQIVFPDVQEPGYGYISDIALFDAPKGSQPLYIWPLPKLIDVHEGVVPVIHDGSLLRGMEVQARVIAQSDDRCMGGCL